MANINLETNKFSTESSSDYILKKNTDNLIDPLLIQGIQLNNDIYAITFNALRKNVEVETFRGEKIFLLEKDFFWLKIRFIGFILLVGITLGILFEETFSETLYSKITVPILILRITLMTWAQKKLSPEFNQSISMFNFVLQNPEEFQSVGFAIFVSLFQIIITSITFILILIYICEAHTVMHLVMHFASLSIISQLDNWIGESILNDSPKNSQNKNLNKKYNMKNINERMSLNAKLSFLHENKFLINDGNIKNGIFSIIFSWIIRNFPWFLLPLITLPANFFLFEKKSNHSE